MECRLDQVSLSSDSDDVKVVLSCGDFLRPRGFYTFSDEDESPGGGGGGGGAANTGVYAVLVSSLFADRLRTWPPAPWASLP